MSLLQLYPKSFFFFASPPSNISLKLEFTLCSHSIKNNNCSLEGKLSVPSVY
jgi:hypothetical protein